MDKNCYMKTNLQRTGSALQHLLVGSSPPIVRLCFASRRIEQGQDTYKG